jgi:hypothetical protein
LLPLLDEANVNTATMMKCERSDADYKVKRDLQTTEGLGLDGYVVFGREGNATQNASRRCPSTPVLQCNLTTKRGRDRCQRRKAIVELVLN